MKIIYRAIFFLCPILFSSSIQAVECGIDYFESWAAIKYDSYGRPIYTGETGCFTEVTENDCWQTQDCWQYVSGLDAMVFNPTTGGDAYRIVITPIVPLKDNTYTLILLLAFYSIYIYRKEKVSLNKKSCSL